MKRFEHTQIANLTTAITKKGKCVVFLICIFFTISTAKAQVIFSEPFDEATGATIGNDNVGGVAWATSCPSCVPTADYFEVKSNVLQCDDTNGPATWTTGSIDVSSCASGLLYSMDIDLASATNPFEECGAGCGCTCVDWISVEYNPNGSGFIPLTSAQGGTCGQTCSGGTYVVLGSLTSGTAFTFSTCLPAANTLEIRITLQTWAQGEIYKIDNVTVSCSNCALPIELMNFDAKWKNKKVELNWTTATEINNEYFTIERSLDARNFEPIAIVNGAGNSNNVKKYKDHDPNPLDAEVSYYRLKQTDFDNTFSYSRIVAVEKNKSDSEFDFSIVPNPSESGIFSLLSKNNETSESTTIEILDYTGRIMSAAILQANSSSIDLSSYSKGLYIVRINSDGKVSNYKIMYQ